MHSSISLLLIGDNSSVEVLRCLTSIELFISLDYYGKHCCFDLAFNSQKDKIRPLHYFFCLSLKGATIDHFSNDNIGAVKNEAILNCKDFEWSSFMCLLGLSSVLKGHVLSFYPDVGDFNHKHLFNCHITPRTSSINQKCCRILFCRNEPFGTFVKPVKFQSNHFVPLLPTIQKRKKSNPSHTSLASKKVCLKLPEMESLASRFNKGKQSKLEFKPCLKPLFVSPMVSQSTSSTVFLNSDCVRLNTSTLPTSSSSSVTSVSLSSFNCSSRNTASKVDCTIQAKYKNDISTFFLFAFFK